MGDLAGFHHQPYVANWIAPDADTTLRLQQISTSLMCGGNIDALYDRVLDAAISLMSADIG
jgi:hypothetical protein